jgi:hypothetical protein
MVKLKMTESQLMAAVLDLAKYRGLLVHHCRPARQADGSWRTPIQGAKGFPDIVAVGLGGVLFAELKNDVLAPTPEQATWLGTLDAAGADARLWRPKDWLSGEIQDALARLAKPKAAS